MHRTIAVAVIVFAFAAFALQKASFGPFEEPLLLLVMGTLFLLVGRLFARAREPKHEEPAQPHLVAQREART